MPYIRKEDRKRYDYLIDNIVDRLVEKLPADNGKHYSEGDLNYVMSSIVWKLFNKNRCYANGNTLVGAIESVKLEFYRRQLAVYEDEKIKSSGDIL